MKPRVFVLAPVDKPIYTAAEYGEIVFVFNAQDRPIPHTSKEFQQAIIRKLESMSYDPQVDYLLLVGAFVPLIVFVATVCDQYLGPQALAFDMRQGSYYSISLGIEEEPNEEINTKPVPTGT